MFLTQMEHWQFTHMHEKNSSEIDADMRKERAMQCARLGLEVERAMITCVGTKRRHTYVGMMQSMARQGCTGCWGSLTSGRQRATSTPTAR